jgi:hypothetical protein
MQREDMQRGYFDCGPGDGISHSSKVSQPNKVERKMKGTSRAGWFAHFVRACP